MSNYEMLNAASGALPLLALLGMTAYFRIKRPGALGVAVAGGLATVSAVLSLAGMHAAGRLPNVIPLAAYITAVFLVGLGFLIVGATRSARPRARHDA